MHKIKITRKELIVIISGIMLSLSISINAKELFENDNDFNLEYEYINIKDMAKASIAIKKEGNILNNIGTGQSLSEANMGRVTKEEIKKDSSEKTENKRIWYLPTEVGRITQNPSYWHFAHDLTSYRGTNEVIHPVANGVVSGMYRDAAGAIIVTVLHNVNGKNYTSQYVHLSRYEQGLYVGKPVTINDSLGYMGSTGNSTGVHLHIAVLDCALFSQDDPNCRDTNAWYKYGQKRYTEGFYGLWSLLDVPAEWYSR